MKQNFKELVSSVAIVECKNKKVPELSTLKFEVISKNIPKEDQSGLQNPCK